MSCSSEILRGHTETIILGILKAKDSYDYEIMKIIIENGLVDIKDATIYTIIRHYKMDRQVSHYLLIS